MGVSIEPLRNRILIGDAASVLKGLPSESVDMCATSPPYYGLRDYGTAAWIGGDPNCDHLGAPMATRANINRNCAGGRDVKNAACREPFKGVCGKCGAVRQDDQIGLEETPREYISKLVGVFREVRRVLRKDGTLWLNIGDSYAGSGKGSALYPDSVKHTKQGTSKGMIGAEAVTKTGRGGCKPKDLIGIPWMLAFALRDDGWYLRQDIIWTKPNPMPESVADRCTKAHEYIFLLSKSNRYYFNAEAIKEPCKSGGSGSKDGMRNKRDVWEVAAKPYRGAHFATFPVALIEPCVAAGCPPGGIVLDPFMGSGTAGVAALKRSCNYLGIELNPAYAEMARERIGEYSLNNKKGETNGK
jgi:DNA modification methylase